MKLLVIVLCLLSERFLMHSASYQRFNWFNDYASKIIALFDTNKWPSDPWLMLAALLLPIILPILIIYLLCNQLIFGFVGLLMSIVLFFYCLGPQNAFYPLTTDSNESVQVGRYFSEVNHQLFAVVFWYIIAGPIGALTYRLLNLSQAITPVSIQAQQITNLLEWVPARLTVLLYLLVGNFQKGFATFTQYMLAKPELNQVLLSEGGIEAAKANPGDEIPMTIAEQLVEHATIVLLVLIALFTLVAWM